MTKELIKKGVAEAEKQQQQNQVEKIKQIVLAHLEKIAEKKEKRKELDQELRLLEKDLDDFKSGRLDRIVERHEVDPKAKEVRIIIVEKVEKQYIPQYPWRSPWTVNWSYVPSVSLTSTSPQAIAIQSAIAIPLVATGVTISNFARGAYEVDGRVVNL